MQLNKIINNIEFVKLFGDLDKQISGITCDSRKVSNNYIYAAIKGNSLDGHNFIEEAANKRAVCIITERNIGLAYSGITGILVKDVRYAYAVACSNFFESPSYELDVIGITGTNGKTTCLYLIEHILERAGKLCGRIGTIDYKIGQRVYPALNTTPDAALLQSALRQMVNGGVEVCIMEVSSHSLHQRRVEGIRYKAAIFTNLSREHLDYHNGLEDYFRCKSLLFNNLKEDSLAVINIDDKYGRRLIEFTKAEVLTYGFDKKADIKALDAVCDLKGTSLLIKTPKGEIRLNSELIGRHNIYNILAAVALSIGRGIDSRIIKEAVEEFDTPAGRLERIEAKEGFLVFVDYAHTDDALEKVLSSLRSLVKGRIITVFGCGGERDIAKRPRMAAVAAKLSDFVIITSDNPRSEDPQEIISQIKRGVPSDFKDSLTIGDRSQAIEKALQIAAKGDIVLVAGKGHETKQIFKEETVPFDDREVVRSLLEKGVSYCSH